MELNEAEKNIIDFIREARPFEVIEIHKDKLGRPDMYLVKRTQKIIVSEQHIQAVKISLA